MSPMMTDYLEKKKENPDSILFYRLGDFYECFYDDAVLVSQELEIQLTGKDCGEGQRAPMCGVPFHALDTYLARLVEKGHKVAICEQLTEPVKGKIVQRGVVRIVTPGTIVESEILNSKKNNFLASVYLTNKKCAIAYVDVSTGEFYVSLLDGDNLLGNINDELIRIAPSEIICNTQAKDFAGNLSSVVIGQLPKFNSYYEWAFVYSSAEECIKNQYGLQSLSSLDIIGKDECICACGALIEYCLQTQKRKLSHLKHIKFIRNDMFMYLDSTARRNLELTASMHEGRKKGTLLSVLDGCVTPMGARFLKSAIDQPLQSELEINLRLDAVEKLYSNTLNRETLVECLKQVGDIERICSRIVYGSVSPKDCIILKKSLQATPIIKKVVNALNDKKLLQLGTRIADFSELADLLEKTIKEDANLLVRDGNVIKEGFNKTLDEYRVAKKEGTTWLANLEAVERERTGIKNLKIKYNRVFGYFIEVLKSNLDKVPNDYERKQTILNNERFITKELKEIENKILNSEENAIRLENEIYDYVKNILNENVEILLEASSSIAEIDFLSNLANIAVKNGYHKPKISNKYTEMDIRDGRHPVVEILQKDKQFIANDILLNDSSERIMILTGPNMAGKSTYMRQIAIIAIMAQMGSFVPCEFAQLPIFDRVFTRVGASDDLAYGQSTFMVEMSEVANILNNATDRSLIILDEVGRGTSTYDGLSIAWSIMEFLSKNLNAKTLFATHYHELTELEGSLDGVKNYRISVKETDDGIVFLRKIVKGGAEKSFGIEVAKIAGIPNSVIKRAKDILKKLEVNENLNLKDVSTQTVSNVDDGIVKNYNKICDILNEIDVNNLTPLQAFDVLSQLKNRIEEN